MTNQTEQRENFSPEIKEALEQKNFSGTLETEQLLKDRIRHGQRVQTEYPLERVLTIIQDHKDEALSRHISRDGFTDKSHYLSEDGQFIEGKSPDTERFTNEMIGLEDFSYSAHEASIVGGYLRDTFGEFGCETAIDRILLRYTLGNVENSQMRQALWLGLTSHGTNTDLVQSLKNDYGEEAQSIVREIETTLLPGYAKFYEELSESPEHEVKLSYQTRLDRGIGLHMGVTGMRAKFLVKVIEAAKHKMNYEPGDMSPYYKPTL